MSNFIKRLILTLVAVPFTMFVLFWPQDNHIIIIVLFGLFITFFGSYEIGSLIYKKGINVRRFFLPIINILIYIFAYFYANNFFNIQKFRSTWVLFCTALIGVISFVFARDIIKKDLSRSFEKIAYTLLGIVYIGLPSFLVPFILNIELNPIDPVPIFFNVESKGTLTGSLMSIYFLVNIFSNDISSYVFGMTFGRKSVIKLEASPNKSWAGYIGGYIATFFWVTIFYILFDRILGFLEYPWWFYYSIPVLSGFLIPIGDLVESVIKRSANVKDSGGFVLGRGGVLDSVDTILFFLPIYFIFLQIYFAFTS